MPIVRFGAICINILLCCSLEKFALRSGRFPAFLVRFTFFVAIRGL